ncbi:ATPase domain-containing protein, partial [Escherichia coli]
MKSSAYQRISTGFSEFDRLMGGGVVTASVNFLSGEPGAGKSTLLLQLCDHTSRHGLRVLYASGEESLEQISMRAERLGIKCSENLLLVSETCV